MSDNNIWMLKMHHPDIVELKLDYALKHKLISIGWAEPNKSKQHLFSKAYTDWAWSDIYKYRYSVKWIKSAAFWGRFLMDIRHNDLVILPLYQNFYLAKIIDKEPILHKDKVFSRKIKLLSKEPINIFLASEIMQRKMKLTGIFCHVGLIKDIFEKFSSDKEILETFEKNKTSIESQILNKLVDETLDFLKNDKTPINPDSFENIIKKLMTSLGADDTDIPPKNYRGKTGDIDVVASFSKIGITIGVQAKFHKDEKWETGTKAVEQVVAAQDDTHYGKDKISAYWVITLGKFDNEAKDLAEKHNIRLIEGRELAEMIVKNGVLHF